MKNIPVPLLMADLERDARGFPAPVIVMRDSEGRPILAANDEGERQRCFHLDLCHICGKPLQRGRWFVGGHMSACAEHGAFMDGGMHESCTHYALQVCPYMAAPSYGKLVGTKQLAKSDRADVMLLHDDTAGNSRPEFFVAVMAVAQEETRATLMGRQVVRLVKPKPNAVRKVEVWRHGVQITERKTLAAFRAMVGVHLEAIPDMPRPDVWKLLGGKR